MFNTNTAAPPIYGRRRQLLHGGAAHLWSPAKTNFLKLILTALWQHFGSILADKI
jgi:hypothetical protein